MNVSDEAVIAQLQHPSGAYPAAPNFEPYQHAWFRDGSYVADAMSQAGNNASAEAFFAWGARIITARREMILAGSKLDARYTYEGKEVPGEWGSFQLDGFGLFLWALKRHAQRHGASLRAYEEAIELTQVYLSRHYREDCFDWWEEREGRHEATLACIYAGLRAFDHPEAEEVKALINLNEERTDASLLAVLLLCASTEDAFRPILERIERDLKEADGGVHRYADDTYYGGGTWPVLAAMLGMTYADMGRTDEARKQLAWCEAQRGENGWLPEQAANRVLNSQAYEDWVAKQGKSAMPLLWSHAMVIALQKRLADVA